MGQYYQSVIVDKEGKANVYYNYGLKLMEHSYFLNDYVNYVCKKLVNNPHKVAWVGDYADAEEDGMQFIELIKLGQKRGKQVADKTGFTTLEFIMVNHTKKLYVDMCDYYNNAVRNSKEEDLIVHPLPLLTAIGNGKGGGDYWEKNPGIENVGTWAGDEIEFMSWDKFDGLRIKDSYVKTMYFFKDY